MAGGTPEDVDKFWHSFTAKGAFGWSPTDYLDYGRYLVKKGKLHQARPYLEYVINPPANVRTDLPGHGEVFVLWLQAAKDATPAERDGMFKRMDTLISPIWDLHGEALAEYMYGQQLMVFGQTPEAVKHYRRVAALAPTSSLAHQTLGEHLTEIGEGSEGKREFLEAYRFAPVGRERDKIRMIAHLTQEDTASLDHP